MTTAEIIATLLAVISLLLGVIAFFMVRIFNKMDGLFADVHKIKNSFLMFRQRVSIMLGIPVDDDDDTLSTQSTSPT